MARALRRQPSLIRAVSLRQCATQLDSTGRHEFIGCFCRRRDIGSRRAARDGWLYVSGRAGRRHDDCMADSAARADRVAQPATLAADPNYHWPSQRPSAHAPRGEDAIPMVFRRLGGSISAAGLYLSLGARQEPQLRGVNLEVSAGEIVAVTGASGSGKSTLLKILLGLYPQYMGTVRLGGLDMRQLDPAEIRSAIGYAPQQPTFFYGSVAANLRFACPERNGRRHSRGVGHRRHIPA